MGASREAHDWSLRGNLKRPPRASAPPGFIKVRASRNPLRLERLLRPRKLETSQQVGMAAHEFNNALAAILGWAQLGCQESSEGTPVHDTFKRICIAARNAAYTTSQMLALTRRQTGPTETIDLNDLVLQTADLMRSVIRDGVVVTLGLSPSTHVIQADAGQIEQVLMNLCLNARDAMPQGGRIVIESETIVISQQADRVCRLSRSGTFVRLAVSDTGMGIDKGIVNRIFRPFFTTKSMEKGTGLGLAIVDGIVKRHQGFINVRSEAGHGTTFEIYFPAFKSKVRKPSQDPGRHRRNVVETKRARELSAISSVKRSTLGETLTLLVPSKSASEENRLNSYGSTP